MFKPILAVPPLISISLLLHLLVTLSVPFIKPLYLFSLSTFVVGPETSPSGTYDVTIWFGPLGHCEHDVTTSTSGAPTYHQSCGTQFGYNSLGDIEITLMHDDPHWNRNFVPGNLTTALILHPLTCAAALAFLLASLISLFRPTSTRTRPPTTTPLLLFGLLAALFSTTLFIIDVVLVATVRNRTRADFDGQVALRWGNAVWVAFGATVGMWLAFGAACLDVCAGRGRAGKRFSADTPQRRRVPRMDIGQPVEHEALNCDPHNEEPLSERSATDRFYQKAPSMTPRITVLSTRAGPGTALSKAYGTQCIARA
ncbi:hypothetical protein BDW22DRAFT_1346042 [Trametopsis cervina]|nr:hypothetical protein BDW22DRAFT_1346042 [Trametopsis cervina]